MPFGLIASKIEIAQSIDGDGGDFVATVTFSVFAGPKNEFAVKVKVPRDQENDVLRLGWEELHRVTSQLAEMANLRASGTFPPHQLPEDQGDIDVHR